MDQKAKRKLLRDVPYGLYVIGVGMGDDVDAFTGSWLTQASMDPPVVALGVRNDSRALALIEAHRVFSINFMARTEQPLLKHCAAPDREGKGRLAEIAHHPGVTGTPVLDVAIGHLECRVLELLTEFGDHALAVAEVVEATVTRDERPIVMADTGWKYAG